MKETIKLTSIALLLAGLFSCGKSTTPEVVEHKCVINSECCPYAENHDGYKICHDYIDVGDLYELCAEINLKHMDVVIRLAVIETDDFSSELFMSTNNLFGMKKSKKRPRYCLGYNQQGYAIYYDWHDSVIDYALHQAYFCSGMTEEEYIDYIIRSYVEDKDYKGKLKSKEKLQDTQGLHYYRLQEQPIISPNEKKEDFAT